MVRPAPTALTAFLALALCAHASPAAAQGLGHAIVEGVVRDTTGAPVFEARVVLREEPDGTERVARTPRDGDFHFWLLPPGEYSVLVERLGYVPRRIGGIRVRPGVPLALPVTLREGGGGAQIDSVHFQGSMLAGGGAGLRVALPRPARSGYPDERRELSDMARFSGVADAGLQMQGLPAQMSGVRVNGSPTTTLIDPSAGDGALRAPHLPISLFDAAELVVTDPDVEWSGYAGGSLTGHARRGSRSLRAEGYGTWAGDPLRLGAGSGYPSYGSTQVGALLSGSIVPDTASFLFGVEAWQLGAPAVGLVGSGDAAQQAAMVAREVYGVNLITPEARARRTDAVSGFGRFDWRPSEASAVSVLGYGSALPSAVAGTGTPPEVRAGREWEGYGLGAQVSFISRLGERAAQEFRLEVDAGRRGYDAADLNGVGATTWLAAEGVRIGPEPIGFGVVEQRSVRISEVVHLHRAQHRFKLGVRGDFEHYSPETADIRELRFGSAADLAARRGYLVASTGGPVSASFGLPRLSLFAQDSWNPVAGLEVLVGVRAETERLPVTEIAPNLEWLRLTGLSNADLQASWFRVNPRFGFRWDVEDRHRWVLHGSAGSYSGATEANLVAETLTHTGGLSIRRGFGTVGSLSDPGSAEIPVTGPALTLLDPDFAAPRTARAHLGISRAIGEATAIHLAGLYRYTDFLARRTDLNLVQSSRTDMAGRPLHGRTVQQGGLLFPDPGSNRRFPSFDGVYAINQDAWSEHQAVMLSVERHTDSHFWFARYTGSRTTDNRPGAGAGALPPALSPTLGTDGWEEGVSDLDVPHRLAVGAQLRLPTLPGAQLGVLYELRSGYPYTPGAGEGLDLDGDGSGINDIAYLDAALPGLDEVLAGATCSRGSAGAVAERNACRTDAVQSLDARLQLSVGTFGGVQAQLLVDALNLLGSSTSYPDRALVLVDPAGTIGGGDGAAVRLPLRANEQFGEARFRLQPGRQLRLGIRVEL